jgi:hypothetical protein
MKRGIGTVTFCQRLSSVDAQRTASITTLLRKFVFPFGNTIKLSFPQIC